MDNGMSKKQEVCEQWNYDAMIKRPSEKAKEWFRRPPYSVKGSDAGGQEEIKTVSSVTKRDTKNQERHIKTSR